MNHQQLLAAIEARYGIALPPTYRHAVAQGWIDPGVWENYTPLFMGEWLSLQAILDYDFQAVEKNAPANPGLIPFAQSPGGDPYCWHSGRAMAGEPVVGYTEFGEFDRLELVAPSLLGFVYRNALEQLSAGCEYEDERTAKHNLARWRATWFPLFPRAWQQTLAAIPDVPLVEWTRTLRSGYQERGRSFLHPDECQKIIARDLQFPGLGQTLEL
ncbi:MAG: SMI1/KNR4 family protein [Pirellulaceae bacterium]|nr:SMI1/KNR4 family protein [Pirellulaceae bacterium]